MSQPPSSAPGLDGVEADGRAFAPSALRNSAAILDALGPVLAGASGLALEIGSGTGQHIAAWAGAFPQLDWQPSEPFDELHDSIRAWAAHAGCPNLRPPLWLDAAEPWPDLGPLTAVISANVIHITPWVVTRGLVRGAASALAPGGKLIFYGPFREGGTHTGEGNARFDETLRARDPAWGIRNLEDVVELAMASSFAPPVVTVMPANNRFVVFERGAAG